MNPNGNNTTPRQQWEVSVSFPDTTMEGSLKTHNKRDARRRYDMIVKYSQEPIGKYSGCSVRLLCDSEILAGYKP